MFDTDRPDYTTSDYIKGTLWMLGVFGPGLAIIAWCGYKFFA